MPTISIGTDKYLIDAGRTLAQIDEPNVVNGALAVRNVLRACVGDYFAMQQLRNLIMELHVADRVNVRDDVAVAEHVANMVWSGRLHLIDLTPPATSVRKFLTWDSVATPPPPPRPASPPPRGSSEAPAPSFSPALDAVLLAAMLVAAAAEGTPFCEECERAGSNR